MSANTAPLANDRSANQSSIRAEEAPRIQGDNSDPMIATEDIQPSVHAGMARFRSSLLRRASAVAWVVLIVIGAQAVREQVFDQPSFFVPMAILAVMLAGPYAIRDKEMCIYLNKNKKYLISKVVLYEM